MRTQQKKYKVTGRENSMCQRQEKQQKEKKNKEGQKKKQAYSETIGGPQ